MSAPSVVIHAYGCQMNKLDAELVLGKLLDAGYVPADEDAVADVILFHTCSVREHAEARVYSNAGKLKHLKRRRPGVVIGILGCMAQKDREAIFARLPHVDLVCGTREFPRIVELVEEVRRRGRVVACGEDVEVTYDRDVAARPNRFQAYVGIMRGCDNFCAYCIVPYLRGRETSRPPGEVVDEVRRLVDDGVREVTLLGQNVNSYGKSFGRAGALADLLRDLGGIQGLIRLRFVTSHPKDMTRPILDAMRDVPCVCESLHMPAQSGSDRILKRMNRGYTNAQYRDIAALARDLVPGIAIASDFIVGFPGETRADYEETEALVREMRFQNSFIFKYSPRPGTRAAKMADDVPWAEKKRRNAALLAAQEAVNRQAHAAMIGEVVEVLVEGRSKRDARRLTGRTRTNRIVVFEGAPGLAGRLAMVRITDATPLTLAGELVSAEDDK